jgi:hypothetical protein
MLAVVAAALALAGCARAIRLELDVPETGAARVSARLTKGKTPPVPDSCQLPCGLSIEPSTSSELTVTAPGYYPAVVSVAYEQMLTASKGNVARLVVPLVKRPERTAAAGEAPPEAPAEGGGEAVAVP